MKKYNERKEKLKEMYACSGTFVVNYNAQDFSMVEKIDFDKEEIHVVNHIEGKTTRETVPLKQFLSTWTEKEWNKMFKKEEIELKKVEDLIDKPKPSYLKRVWNIIGVLATVGFNMFLLINGVVNNVEPTNYQIYLGIMLYLLTFVKNELH